jgi:predicted acyl esterase
LVERQVGLNGVSYLAISQWKVAALRLTALAAICPWKGWTDVYRDVAYPGGVREDGFILRDPLVCLLPSADNSFHPSESGLEGEG